MPKTLLIADDSVTIRKVIEMLFSTEDFTITAVDNGLDAIAKTRELRPDLVLADAVMPGKNGYEVCEALKSDPATQGIPVMLLGGTFEAFDENRARAAKADAHILKPFESNALLDKVRQLIGGVKTQPQPAAYSWQTQAQAGGAPAAAPQPAAAPRSVSQPQIPQAQPAGGPLPRAAAPAPGQVGRPSGPAPAVAAPRPGMAPGQMPGGMPAGPRPGSPPPGAVPPGGMRPGMQPPAGARPGMPAGQPGPAGMAPPGARPGMAQPAAARPGMPPQGAPMPGAPRPGMPGPGAVRPGGPAGAPGQPMARPAVGPPGGAPAAAPSPYAGMSQEAILRDVLSKASRELIEKIVWEVVPQLAEVIIREHVERLAKERDTH